MTSEEAVIIVIFHLFLYIWALILKNEDIIKVNLRCVNPSILLALSGSKNKFLTGPIASLLIWSEN